MRVDIHNEAAGRREPLRSAQEPRCRLFLEPFDGDELSRFRLEAFSSFLEKTLAYMGWTVEAAAAEDADLHVGARAPASASAQWLKPAGVSGGPAVSDVRAKGFDPLDLRLLCLKTHYRRTLKFSWDQLAAARDDRSWLRGMVESLQGQAGLAPNAAGLAGYKKRLRDSLARDLDGPEAVATLLDALRPGALSPGSRLGAIKDADSVLGVLTAG